MSAARATSHELPVVALILASGALSRRFRLAALTAAVGWLLGGFSVASDDTLPQLDPLRPVEVNGSLDGRWENAEFGWQVWLEVESIRQGGGGLPAAGPARLLLYLAGRERPPPGRSIWLRGYARPPSRLLNGSGQRTGPWRLTVSSRQLVRIVDGGRWQRWRGWQTRLRDVVDRRLDRRRGMGGALARGLLLGDVSDLPNRQLLALRRLGLGHLVAVSGLHLALLIGVAWLLTGWAGQRLRLACGGAVAMLYLLLVGARPSLVRASLMSAAVLLSLAAERRPDALNAWAVAIGVMVAWRPSVLDEIGFQLTAAATLGLIIVSPGLAKRWSRCIGAPLARPLAVSIGAHIATLPWSVAVFHLWAPASVGLNLLAVPLTALAVPVALLAVLFEPLAGLGDLLWQLFAWLSKPYEWVALLPAGSPWSVPVARPFASVSALVLALVLGLPRLPRAAALALVLSTAVYLSAPMARGEPGPELVMLDVGQGESILIRDGGEAILVDGGGWRRPGLGQSVLLPALLELGVRRLRGVVLTHPDLDHCGGLVELAALVPVGRVWSVPGWHEGCYQELIGMPGVLLSPLWRGRRFDLGRWSLEVLHPVAGREPGGNDDSLVLRATCDRWSVLLTGDSGVETERRLLGESDAELAAVVLKVGHHGSRSSSSAAFLDRVAPRVALISAGSGNVYGHPTEEVLARLAERRAQIWRTDRGGQIRLRFGTELVVSQPWSPAGSTTVSYNLPRIGEHVDHRHRGSHRHR